MPLREVKEAPGAPWNPPLQGELEQLTIESEVLADNPLGDPARRPLYVYLPPAAGQRPLPAIYMLQGYGGQVDAWLARDAFEPTLVERLDATFDPEGEGPQAIVVFVDAWTSLGGSQFLNSTGTGRYLDYLCDEVVPFVDARFPTLAASRHRGLFGKSSGGYGATVVPMLRPGLFGALASVAGDALFECCYLRDFPVIARQLRDHFEGSYEVLLEHVRERTHFDWGRFGAAFSMYAYAAAYSPDPERPGKALLPFEIATGRLIDEIWQRWLEQDPVRMAPSHAEALGAMRQILLTAGRGDEFYLDLGAQALAHELESIGARYRLDLFDGGHGGISHRYPDVIRELVEALEGEHV